MKGRVSGRLIVFTRYPEPGQAKTRLIPLLGRDGAAELHRQMTDRTLAVTADLQRQMPEVNLVVRFAGGTQALLQRFYGTRWVFEDQGSGDLGERLDRAVRDAFADGLARVVVIGSDCPELTSDLLRCAFQKLDSADIVIGPAADGGYYLIGLRRIIPSLFAGMPWGTSGVLDKTLAEAKRLRLDVGVLPTLRDVDRPEDIAIWEQAHVHDHAITCRQRCRSGGAGKHTPI